ncbi:DUF1624 domain-containing protein [Parapedobacter sp. DT-150]|uniref:DUF1624 domain-containing protein n=1 Tax=Parapedobacter sp. DT-150 TaxID=3396162 RepID=UPI003F1D05A6
MTDQRLISIDFTRGIVMIIMALDHVRELIHVNAAQDPTDLATTTPMLFLTRWVTHLCAPTFVFLAGLSVYLLRRKHTGRAQTRKYLLTRGLWLVILEFTLVNFGMFFDVTFSVLLFEVIAAIGAGFIILAFLLPLGSKTVALLGIIIIACHEAFALIPFGDHSLIKTLLQPLFVPSVFPVTSVGVFVVGYPPIPWLGIMLAGYGIGPLFERPSGTRKRVCLQIGIGALLLFVIVRLINGYGNAAPWSPQENGLYTMLSFINITKYPPSLLFCLVTLGIMFLILAFAERLKGNWVSAILVYGRVPLYYFLLHFYLIHLLLIAILLLQGFSWSQLSFASGTFGRPQDATSGVSLIWIYLIWISVVLALYKPSAWFGRYKASHKQWWLSYL